MLKDKHIVVGVTGGIAAYKSAMIIRLLVKQGAEVKVVMTPTAKQFITPLTLATLAKSPVLVDFFNPENGEWNSHVSLGLWADAMVIAPATAATIGKMANGVADNLLVTTYLSAKCPVFLAPAMDLDMWHHPTTQRNLQTLREFGNIVIEPNSGELASGLDGKGRMAEPEQIVDVLDFMINRTTELEGKRILVNGGGTIERIDPVRFITNDSSGKMACSIARELAIRGAEVIFVAARMSVNPEGIPGVTVRRVESADQMYVVCMDEFDRVDAAILAAAVADYTPAFKSEHKLKKSSDSMSIELLPTHDIAAELGACKGERKVVGFALETDNEFEHAEDKLIRKNLDFIVLNSLRDQGAGLGVNTNKITILRPNGMRTAYELKSKTEVARDIVDELIAEFEV
jgi:phosphopantothenoylcysteine decarboxylase/phosphopantothenate--cysteine ligase